jgi:hydroxyacylglutathione hydrolase
MLKIFPIPAFEDNYIWVLQKQGNAFIVDPGDAAPVLNILRQYELNMAGILITHHHHDHIDGVARLLDEQNVPVYAPSYGKYPFATIPVKEGDIVTLNEIQTSFRIMWLPGHTQDHIAYVNSQYLFSGDVLFGAGCGRLLDGTATQMFNSLQRIKLLPPNTLVFCTHEYTLKNIAFACTLESHNQALMQRKQEVQALRHNHLPSLPSTIQLELDTNPFLRCDQTEIIHNSGLIYPNQLEVFTKIREMRNHY